MDELNKDVTELVSAARNAIEVLRRTAEQLETEGRGSESERDAVRRLNTAVQLVEYDLARLGVPVARWDWRDL